MKKKYFINANIIDPKNSLNEKGGLIINEEGKIEAVGKKVNKNNIPSREKYIDVRENYIFPGLVDMRVFVGEPGYEYKENFRTLSNAALCGGVTSVVTMPNTNPVIDNVSMVDFLKRRGRDKSKINIFPTASLTKNLEGTNMTEFGLLQKKGIIGFTDGFKTIQNSRLMSRIMSSANDLGSLIMQHAEDSELAEYGMVNDGIISTKLGLQGIPDIAEKIIIERDLTLLEEYNCRYHISQISSAKSIDIIKLKKQNLKFSCGVSINNLSLNANDIGDFKTLSNAALSGGVTSVVTMPNTNPVIDNVSMVDFLKRRGRDKSKINIFPTASLTKNLEGTNMTEFGLLQKKGIIGFTDGLKTIQNSRLMSRIMNSAADLKCLIMQHAEDSDLAKYGMVNDGIISTKLGLQGIPDIAEKIIIERDLTLLEEYSCRYHISQISSEKSVDIIEIKKQNLKFSCGVSINNLSLNENDIGNFRTFLKLSPPLRREEDRVSLVEGLNKKVIDVIVSDHKPEDEEQKRLTFAQAASGSSGIETLLALSLELYHNESIKLETIIQALTFNPAKILKINKGNLDIGNDADFCIVDINKPWIVKKDNLISKSKNTSIDDKKLQGKVTNTFVNGVELFKL